MAQETRVDCGECGQNVGVRERHTFVDCALYAADHHGPPLNGLYARALVKEVRRLRELLGEPSHAH